MKTQQKNETLLNEYKTEDKANKFIDRSLGEYDTIMDPEERGFQWRDKKDMYSLNEEELTHTDQSLSEMEKLNDLVDDEADEKGILSAKLTASHFGGGGLLRRKTPGEKDDKENHKVESRQQLFEELILKSKQEKSTSFSKMSSGQNHNFLLGVLQLAVSDETSTGYSVVQPFRQSWKGSDPLRIMGKSLGLQDITSSLVLEKKKPIPLELLTPKIVEVSKTSEFSHLLNYGKKQGNMKEEREKERLDHKYKKEFKEALTEICKDTHFLAPEKLSEVMGRDAKRKVKELFGSLATQEGEWKTLKRRRNSRQRPIPN
ncbi:uncharacterized protein [Oncorhynchus clarkii lewisi]|uniref:uncharacterized protein n=1 Tax=Oncorhynchus clarkii lewisi TaxID=490388 RepID=UPI0039B91BC3